MGSKDNSHPQGKGVDGIDTLSQTNGGNFSHVPGTHTATDGRELNQEQTFPFRIAETIEDSLPAIFFKFWPFSFGD